MRADTLLDGTAFLQLFSFAFCSRVFQSDHSVECLNRLRRVDGDQTTPKLVVDVKKPNDAPRRSQDRFFSHLFLPFTIYAANAGGISSDDADARRARRTALPFLPRQAHLRALEVPCPPLPLQ